MKKLEMKGRESKKSIDAVPIIGTTGGKKTLTVAATKGFFTAVK